MITDINLSQSVGLSICLPLAVVAAVAIKSTVADSTVTGDTAVAVVNTRDDSATIAMCNLKVGMMMFEGLADDNDSENYKKKPICC